MLDFYTIVLNYSDLFYHAGQNEDQQMCEPLTQEELLSQEEHWSQQTHVSLSVPTVMQWLTGQRHKPLLPSERADFKINLRFEHHCNEKMRGHNICFSLVSACTNTITVPVEHMKTYKEFRDIMTVAIRMGRDFGRV